MYSTCRLQPRKMGIHLNIVIVVVVVLVVGEGEGGDQSKVRMRIRWMKRMMTTRNANIVELQWWW